MTKQTEALKMAIEALDTLMMEKGSIYQQALQACKEALEKPTFLDECIAEIDAEIERNGGAWVEQPAQKPVAWMNDIAFSMDKELLGTRSRIVPLYTHPAPLQNKSAESWQGNKEFVGLSDDEILIICAKMAAKLPNKEIDLIFARAIETKLKEKNNAV